MVESPYGSLSCWLFKMRITSLGLPRCFAVSCVVDSAVSVHTRTLCQQWFCVTDVVASVHLFSLGATPCCVRCLSPSRAWSCSCALCELLDCHIDLDVQNIRSHETVQTTHFGQNQQTTKKPMDVEDEGTAERPRNEVLAAQPP